MKLYYRGVLCQTGSYRVMGENKPALFYISSPNQETMLDAGFTEIHYGLWLKLLSDAEYREILDAIEDEPESSDLLKRHL
ncbi:MAG: hypothetical protein HFF60_07790 [Oscillospiraceae bacterium]|nr:hypothetical protein [Oscillospiraceae bacterium]